MRSLLRRRRCASPCAVVGFGASLRGLVLKAIDKAQAVSNRRNDLMHGHWSFHGDKFEVVSIQPNSSKPKASQIVTAKSLETLATDYRIAGSLAEGCCTPIRLERNMALKTASTPAPGDPNS